MTTQRDWWQYPGSPYTDEASTNPNTVDGQPDNSAARMTTTTGGNGWADWFNLALGAYDAYSKQNPKDPKFKPLPPTPEQKAVWDLVMRYAQPGGSPTMATLGPIAAAQITNLGQKGWTAPERVAIPGYGMKGGSVGYTGSGGIGEALKGIDWSRLFGNGTPNPDGANSGNQRPLLDGDRPLDATDVNFDRFGDTPEEQRRAAQRVGKEASSNARGNEDYYRSQSEEADRRRQENEGMLDFGAGTTRPTNVSADQIRRGVEWIKQNAPEIIKEYGLPAAQIIAGIIIQNPSMSIAGAVQIYRNSQNGGGN